MVSSTEIEQILNGHAWIKVKRYDEDSSIEDWAAAYEVLLAHHHKETEFLINKVRELAQIIKDGNLGKMY